MGVVRRFGENIPDDAFCKCTLSLILLLYDLHPQTWRYFRSVLYIHGYILCCSTPSHQPKVPQYIINLVNMLKYIIEDFRKTTGYSESVETVITPSRIKYSLAGVTAISSFPKK